jgi:RHS repeat-associated protein
MSGDGLTDIVRIRNNDISYWPNLGYGRFGAKVSMSSAPEFDLPDHFNPQYLKLADLDGSGTTGIVYLAKDSFKIYFNQSGNSWSEENIVQGVNPIPFPKIDDHSNVNIIDLLGNGTGCIVWSSPLPQHAANPLRYIDLMAGRKPHIMVSYKNNMGKEVSIEYKPSTTFYLEDKKAGKPWVTKLPFPVQCVSKVIVVDQIRKARFTNQYKYHHGYYDYKEREFRGFGRVDQTDTEDFENYKKFANPDGSIQLVDERFHMPPMLSKTWFHTGAFLDNEKILDQFAHEYYQNEIVPEKKLQEPVLPSDWTTDEWREALRACKGMPLHAEVYSLDGSVKENHPYTTAQHTCFIQRRQPILKNKNAIFLVSESEAITYSYERNPADPRIAHSMNLEVDEFGNVLKAAAISYGRKTVDGDLTEPEQAEQSKTHIIFSENSTTNKINTAEDYHLPVLFEASTYELTGITPLFGHYYTINDVNTAFEQAIAIDYQTLSTPLTKQRRLIEQVRSVFKKNDQSGPLPPGVIESLALPWQSYKLSLTPALMDSIFGNKVSDDLLLNEGKYVHFDDDNYWIPSGTQTLDAAHFYQVTEMTDPFGYKTKIIYDTAYHLFVQSATDALNNVSSIAGYNFRTLTPYLAMDINDNRSGLRTDELGMVTSTFIIGKEGESKGDFLDESSIEASANDHPGTVFEYELFNYINNGKSNFTKGTLRETHHFENIESGQPVIWQTVYVYVCGAGNPAMIKTQAEPGLALQENADGTFTEVDTTPNIRWVGNGRTIFNNKGNPVKQYEPYFSTTFEFEDAKELVERGVTPVIYYDSAGRVIQTDLPNGTFTKVAFDAWKHQTFDPNDTVLESQWYRDRILVPVPAIGTAEEITAANKAAAHAKTPAIVYIDSLGRTFLSIADNGLAGKYKIVTETDIEGNVRKITDQRGNTVIQYKYNMLGDTLYQHSMDSGERWTINDVMGKLLMSWDAREHIFRTEYDVLHRPVKNFLQTGANLEITINKIVYGEGMANDKQLNLRGKAYQVFDTAGIVTNRVVDFKGNTLQSSRQLCREYTNTINWDTNPALAAEIFISATEFDALNRMVISTLPDSSIVTPTYNEANLLNKVEVQIRGATQITVFVKDINYDVKGQRESILYGNDTKTTYAYDPKTYRLTKLITTGKNGTSLLQQLHYTYDPVGNITFLNDEAQQTIFFNNNAVTPSCDYVYDAVYRLITATGREHIGQNQPVSPYDEFRTSLPMPGDAMAMRNYTQQYEYDAVGNIIQMIHAAGTGSWTRTYHYEAANNRLKNHTVSGIPENLLYDSHGNILSLAHLPVLTWDFRDQLQQINLGGGGTVYYVYDAAGQRIRKVIERQDGTKEERLYLNGVELFRKTTSRGTLQSAIETLNIMDSTRCIAIVETQTVKDGVELQTPVSLTRYQYSNHLGSSSFELDETATIISYEEYHPYGTTSYQAMNADIRAAAKRYRYTGMERDEESGLEYHGARYYLPWLGRWLSADPIGVTAGINFYAYCRGQPTIRTDQKGTDDEDPLQWSGSKEEMVERHARLMDLLIKLDGPIYQRKSVIANYLKKHGDDDVLEHYGYKSPGFFTKQITFQKDVVKALKTYDYGFRKLQGQAAANMNATDAAGLVAAQKDKANWEAGREGYSHVTSSLIAGASASAARLFTDDPIKIAAAAGLGASFSGIFNAYASTYVDRANQPVLSQSQPTISLNLEALEGTSGMGPRNTFRPRSPAVQQSTDYTCVATSCKMVLDDLGWRGISEDRIAAVLNTTPEGAKMWDVPQAIRQLDIPVSRNNLIQDVAFNLAGTMTNVEKALNSGNKVIASMRQGLGYHAVVVDTVTATNVAVRDPDIGATVVMSRSDFENRFTGRMVQFVLKKK